MNKSLRILVVDDEEEFAQHIAWLLKDSFTLDVDIAYSGERALEMITQTPYDLIITDVHMPGIDGMELTLKVREINPNQHLIVMTGYPTREYPEGAFNLGSITYLVKPFHVDRFLELVTSVLGSSTLNDGDKNG